ncbi:MAG: zinc ribbon domain-containing protein [Muribaculaceae bacterium]|nr:zinc ribbon domain-containing protein [Muribaculaceae bacterium]
MALIKCRNCGNLISDKAKFCPKCGAIQDSFSGRGTDIEQNNNIGIGSEKVHGIIKPQDKRSFNIKPLIIALIILVIPGIVACLVYFSLRGNSAYKYSDVLSAKTEEPVNTALITGKVNINGTINDYPFTLDLNVKEDGTLTGKYWNVFYDLSLPVSGRRLSNNNLDLTLGKGNSQSSMFLETAGGNFYNGKWGKKEKPVVAELQKIPRDKSYYPEEYKMRLLVKINGHNKYAVMGDEFFYYEDQGAVPGHIMRPRKVAADFYEIVNDKGDVLGRLDLTAGKLTRHDDKWWSVTKID